MQGNAAAKIRCGVFFGMPTLWSDAAPGALVGVRSIRNVDLMSPADVLNSRIVLSQPESLARRKWVIRQNRSGRMTSTTKKSNARRSNTQFGNVDQRRELHADLFKDGGGVFAAVDDSDESIDQQTMSPGVFNRA